MFCENYLKDLPPTMAKRKRTTEHRRQRDYRSKRSRYFSLSPSRRRPTEIDIDIKIRELEMKIDVLRAELMLLRKEVKELKHPPQAGKVQSKDICTLM